MGPNEETSFEAGTQLEASAKQILENQISSIIVSNDSNIGADNPSKTFPSPRSLFYDGAKLDPGVKNAEKYGLFMFYSFGSGEGNEFKDQYYLSEQPKYNRRISSVASKNPTAESLVSNTRELSELPESSGSVNRNSYNIIGGMHAPYYWKDFIYCKYYGTVPNNRMITLRRFPSPVHDNFSVPRALETPENIKKGVGTPVAQAVTWFGGKTGNSLSSLINFSTGLSWENQPIDEQRIQKAFGDKLIGSVPYDQVLKFLNESGGSAISGKVDEILNKTGTEAVATIANPSSDKIIQARQFRAFFNAVKEDSTRFGVLGEKIWVPVDVIKSTSKRAVGLDFTWEDLVLKFSYDLTSAGEVNTKAAMFDILGNLLSIGTNYGNFLSPYTLLDSEFQSLGFPGGAEGLKLFYTNFEEFIKTTYSGIMLGGEDETPTAGQDTLKAKLDELNNDLIKLQEDLKDDGNLSSTGEKLLKKISKGIESQNAEAAATDWQAPLSLYTGAPIGDWHVVIGNPYNPIAMIGNLICTDVKISFSETLGPDDFPTTIDADITLQHARPRERGEIESIFNRGDGRLYQSVASTSANAQTTINVTDNTGGKIPEGQGQSISIPSVQR